eukprot:TRINITY_DN1993_c1_g2_i2.p1 TRINITY_DN1993_c1_g2~~TRINITY_DN1993_c1_g2_i2.p1  ORF type:complete len:402 (-),score=75.03 TRINITY_DN1993_c1_g2_i2:106-1311(-)
MAHLSTTQHEYIQTKVNPILENLATDILRDKPENPVPLMIRLLSEQTLTPSSVLAGDEADALKAEIVRLQGEVASLEAQLKAGGRTAASVEEEEEEEEDDVDAEEIAPPPQTYLQQGHRASVSAEAYGAWNQQKAFVPPIYEKTQEQRERLREVLLRSFLFQNLDETDLQIIIGATEEREVPADHRVINEGDDGAVMYVVEHGTFVCLKMKDGKERVVKECAGGDVFGELALLYNAPRAASVESREPGVLWELGRDTFNHIVRDASMKRRERYEDFLNSVPILESLGNYERQQLAEALKQETFEAGSNVVAQGEEGNKFYIVESGDLVVQKCADDGVAVNVMRYKAGDYFGELALLREQAPRAASVLALSDAKVLSIDRRTFKALLGSLEEIMRRKASEYS